MLPSTLCTLVLSKKEGGPVGLVRRMSHSFWGDAAPKLGWPPLGKPVGPDMAEEIAGQMRAVHPLHGGDQIFTHA